MITISRKKNTRTKNWLDNLSRNSRKANSVTR